MMLKGTWTKVSSIVLISTLMACGGVKKKPADTTVDSDPSVEAGLLSTDKSESAARDQLTPEQQAEAAKKIEEEKQAAELAAKTKAEQEAAAKAAEDQKKADEAKKLDDEKKAKEAAEAEKKKAEDAAKKQKEEEEKKQDAAKPLAAANMLKGYSIIDVDSINLEDGLLEIKLQLPKLIFKFLTKSATDGNERLLDSPHGLEIPGKVTGKLDPLPNVDLLAVKDGVGIVESEEYFLTSSSPSVSFGEPNIPLGKAAVALIKNIKVPSIIAYFTKDKSSLEPASQISVSLSRPSKIDLNILDFNFPVGSSAKSRMILEIFNDGYEKIWEIEFANETAVPGRHTKTLDISKETEKLDINKLYKGYIKIFSDVKTKTPEGATIEMNIEGYMAEIEINPIE